MQVQLIKNFKLTSNKMSKAINIHFVDRNIETPLGPPFTLENIADLAYRAIEIPAEEFMDRCRVFYIND